MITRISGIRIKKALVIDVNPGNPGNPEAERRIFRLMVTGIFISVIEGLK